VIFEVDYADVSDRIIVTNKKSIWGKSVFGDMFITRNINESIPYVIGRRGRNIRFKVSCNYFLDGEVNTYAELAGYANKTNGLLVYVADVNKYYLYYDRVWTEMPIEDMNQRMKLYQINGDYEIRGKR
jgi:hypothetical protein